jgi:hypothetical protein
MKTAIKLIALVPSPLKEKVRTRESQIRFFSCIYSPHPNPLQQERELFLNT